MTEKETLLKSIVFAKVNGDLHGCVTPLKDIA